MHYKELLTACKVLESYGFSFLDIHFFVHLLSTGLVETDAETKHLVTTRMGQRQTIHLLPPVLQPKRSPFLL